jgi:hypothetical protein
MVGGDLGGPADQPVGGVIPCSGLSCSSGPTA